MLGLVGFGGFPSLPCSLVEPTDRDWFGNPVARDGAPPRDPVACPTCGAPFVQAADLRAHVAAVHGRHALPGGGREPTRRSSLTRSRRQRFVDGLRFLPLWFVLPLNLVFAWLVWLSVSDPLWNPAASMVVRLALLPLILLLAARVAGRKPR
jgi:hypothetical protein